MNIPLTPIRFLRYAREQFPQRTAVVCDGQSFTYREFGERAAALAGMLIANGARGGDRIAYLSTNCHRLLEAYFGVIEAGCILLPLNVRLGPADLGFILSDASPRLLLTEERFLPLVERLRAAIPQTRIIQLDGTPSAPWLARRNYEEMLVHSPAVEAALGAVDEDAVAELFYTSGTSDRPKGVMLTHRNVYLHALDSIAAMQTSPATRGQMSCDTVNLHTIPLFHANGWGAAHVITLLGGKHVMIRQFDPEKVFQLIERERVTSCCLVPAMALALLNSPKRAQYDLSSMRQVLFGGAAAWPALVREVEQKLGCVCISGYGLTETSPVLAASQIKAGLEVAEEERHARQARTGYAIPGVELRVVDPDGNDVPRDSETAGEIIARSDGVMAGYWRQPEATEAALRGGWFHTGDLATVDANGYLMIVDREKDIIVSGGENISSLEVEKTLAGHPSVYEAAVIPVPDEQWGEVPRALVVLRPGQQASEAELIEHCRAQLAHYKCPRAVEFVTSLPKSGTDKVVKYELRKKYWEARQVASCSDGS